MLRYCHSFHAGNFADVIKHVVIIEILEYFTRKEKSLEYIDTHAGAGLFQLKSDDALKQQKYANGIGKVMLENCIEDWPELADYFSIIQSYNEAFNGAFNEPGAIGVYPGSPAIAKQLLRSQDKAWLYELHPAEFELLQDNIGHDKRIRVLQEDGFKGIMGLLPSLPGNIFVLIDPPYELKTDYDRVFSTVMQAYKKFACGTYAIWYPVVERQRINQLENTFINSGIKNIQRFELALTADSGEKGMTAAGMIVINPPQTLMAKLSQLLPRLVKTLGEDDGAFFRCDVIVAEEPVS